MDGQWNFRHAYNEAKKVKDDQDAVCRKVEAEDWESLCDQDLFPESLEWESLVEVLRGRVKVSPSLYFSDMLINFPSSPSIATRFVTIHDSSKVII